MEEWTSEYPTEIGFYWAYGTSYGGTELRLSVVHVPKPCVIIRGSEFIYKWEQHNLLFKPIRLPDLPQITSFPANTGEPIGGSF